MSAVPVRREPAHGLSRYTNHGCRCADRVARPQEKL